MTIGNSLKNTFDNMDEIGTFLLSPYVQTDRDLLLFYDFDSWVQRFTENENV